jgi:HD-GYP domain-containing protein (c-di-GMP phosphodiesterase class II)
MIGEDREAKAERIPLARIRPRPPSPRREATEAEIRRLADSIRRHGLLHPLLVRPGGRDYEVVCGQRRLRAARAAGLGEVAAVVRPLDDRRAFELLLAENVGGLSAEERRAFLRRLKALFPGRRPEEFESWLAASSEEVILSAEDPLPGWLDSIPDTVSKPEGVSVVVASTGEGPPKPPPSTAETRVLTAPSGMVLRRRTLLWQARTLLDKLSRTGRLDQELLDEVLEEVFRRFESQPAHEFLDLSYRARTRRYVTRHCLNVCKLAVFLARALGLPPEEIREVAICGLLHDVGMMKIKEEIFTKHAALDAEEWEQVKGHPVEGSLLLTKEVVLRDVVARVALEHHEKPDGTGYPHGKKKNEIHLYARLINVVDTYGAMVSPRAHRLPMLPFEAMRVVMDDGAKGMLDWDLVQSFVRAMSIYPVGSYVRLEGGEIARVIRAQPEIPEKPVVAIIADAQRNVLRVPVEIDLAMAEPTPQFVPVPSPV